MAGALTYNKSTSVQISGVSLSELGSNTQLTNTTDVQASDTLAAAQTGVLTTRTSATAGTITMDSGSHTIVTGALLDIYWASGRGRLATVGTVSTTSVPFTGFTGTLPSSSTVVKVFTPLVYTFIVTGNNVSALAFTGGVGSYVTFSFQSSGNTEQYAFACPANRLKCWDSGDGSTNPIASTSIIQVVVSNGDATQTTTFKVVALTS